MDKAESLKLKIPLYNQKLVKKITPRGNLALLFYRIIDWTLTNNELLFSSEITSSGEIILVFVGLDKEKSPSQDG